MTFTLHTQVRVLAALEVCVLGVALGCETNAHLDLFPARESGEADDTVTPADAAASTPELNSGSPPEPEPSGVTLLQPKHRYSFSGTGTRVVDEASGADGTLINGAELDGNGFAALDGNNDYVELPAGIVSKLRNATFMTWMQWRGNNCWHRVFSFGNTLQGPGMIGDADTELFLTPLDCPNSGITSLFKIPRSQTSLVTTARLSGDDFQQLVLVVDEAQEELRIYLEGERVGQRRNSLRLEELNDVDNWLGQSLWQQDYNLPGVYDEFRIYDVALNDEQVTETFLLGPDRTRR